MGEGEHNSVATAIRSAEFEGFLAGTLFNQGWSVTLRALDIDSLLSYIDSNPTALSLLLISTDVEGIRIAAVVPALKDTFKEGDPVRLGWETHNLVAMDAA